MIDPDIFAISFIARAALKEVAKIRNPENPTRELSRIREEIFHEIRHKHLTGKMSPEEVEAKTAVYESVLRLLPLKDDTSVVQ